MISPRPSYGRTGNYVYRGLYDHGRSGTLTGGQTIIIPTLTLTLTLTLTPTPILTPGEPTGGHLPTTMLTYLK